MCAVIRGCRGTHGPKGSLCGYPRFLSINPTSPPVTFLTASSMASAVFILDLNGKVIISRDYRGDIPMSAVDRFMPMLTELEEAEGEAALAPVLTSPGGITYLYLKHANLYLLALT